MSSIIDGASQNHFTIPHAGSANVEFPNGLAQHIEDLLAHCCGFTIYRSFPTVDAESDFTIYCLLRELERWRDNNYGNYPQTWYTQGLKFFNNLVKGFACSSNISCILTGMKTNS